MMRKKKLRMNSKFLAWQLGRGQGLLKNMKPQEKKQAW